MSNPASAVYEIFSLWRQRVDPSANAGMSVPISGIRSQAEIIRAGRALAEIDTLLARLQRDGVKVAAYQRQAPDWWRSLLLPDYADSSPIPPEGVITNEHLDEIEACASFLDFYVLSAESAQSDNFRQVVAAARQALEADSELSPVLRSYIHRLLREIELALEDEAIGEAFDFTDAVARLYVAFKAAESEQTGAKGTWHGLWTTFVTGTASALAVQGATFAVGAITGIAG